MRRCDIRRTDKRLGRPCFGTLRLDPLAKRVNHTPRTLRMRLAKRILRTSRQSRIQIPPESSGDAHENEDGNVPGAIRSASRLADLRASRISCLVRYGKAGRFEGNRDGVCVVESPLADLF